MHNFAIIRHFIHVTLAETHGFLSEEKIKLLCINKAFINVYIYLFTIKLYTGCKDVVCSPIFH